MATITLTADTLISSLMPSGGGSLASGDTIQLAGHSLIVDADAVDYPVTIANSGMDANLELRQGGRIKLNATLPSTVHPYVDPSAPLAESDYTAGLTANASAEIQLNGTFGLGGGTASLPSSIREGAFWALCSSYDSTHITFDRDFPLHAGDILRSMSWWNVMSATTVVDYNSITRTATISSSVNNAVGYPWVIAAGGVCIHSLSTLSGTMFTSDINAGALVVSANSLTAIQFSRSLTNANLLASRIFWNGGFLVPDGNAVSSISIKELATSSVFSDYNPPQGVFDIGEICCSYFSSSQEPHFAGLFVNGGVGFDSRAQQWRFVGQIVKLSNMKLAATPMPRNNFGSVHLIKCTIGSSVFEDRRILLGGTIDFSTHGTKVGSNYHAPATASDVTWHYADRTVPAGATLRLRCAWQREGSAATRASVAVTDPATWWSQLWPLGADALASVEFTGGTADWRQELLTWRNTSTEAATVRVWECVTGSVGGGYLKVEEVKGGQL